jgi:hypothetical protein
MLPLTSAEHRDAFGACVAKGLCSPIAAVRMLSRAALSMLLTPPRRKGPALRVSVAAPPLDVLLPNTMSDAEWAAADDADIELLGQLREDLLLEVSKAVVADAGEHAAAKEQEARW